MSMLALCCKMTCYAAGEKKENDNNVIDRHTQKKEVKMKK
jgi:hypothetical protein